MDWDISQLLSLVEKDIELIVASDWLNPLVASVLIVFAGYLVSHMFSMRRAARAARLAYLSLQIERLYGPLYTLVQSNTASWKAFRRSFRPNEPLYDRARPFTPEEAEMWRAWAENVFIPSNLKIRAVIESSAHLVEGGRMPAEFLSVIAHIESSKMVIPALAADDLTLLDKFESWPAAFNDYVERSYLALSAEHARLLGPHHRARKLKEAA